MAEVQSNDSLSGTPLNNLTDLYNSFEYNVNGFPRTAMAGGDTVPFIQGLTGAVDIPPNTHPANSGAVGVAGYARTESSIPAVGVFGAALAKANNVNVWGANFIASNTHSQPFPSHAGFQGCTVHGVEVNATIVPLVGGGAPNCPTRGFYASNGSVIVPNGDFNAFDASSSVESGTRWNTAFNSSTGAAEVGLDLWPKETGNSKQSQFIHLRGKNASGAYKTARIWADLSGNLHMAPPDTNSGIYLENSAGTTRMQATNAGTEFFGSMKVDGVDIWAIAPGGGWSDFTPSFGGFSSNPATAGCRFKRVGNIIHVNYDCLMGSSNSGSLTCSLPVPSIDTGASYVRDIPARVRDNGSVSSSWGLIEFDTNATTFTVYRDALGATPWTSSGGKGFRASFTYECAT